MAGYLLFLLFFFRLIFLALSLSLFFWSSILFIYPHGQSHQSVLKVLKVVKKWPLLGKATLSLVKSEPLQPHHQPKKGVESALLTLSDKGNFVESRSTCADRKHLLLCQVGLPSGSLFCFCFPIPFCLLLTYFFFLFSTCERPRSAVHLTNLPQSRPKATAVTKRDD